MPIKIETGASWGKLRVLSEGTEESWSEYDAQGKGRGVREYIEKLVLRCECGATFEAVREELDPKYVTACADCMARGGAFKSQGRPVGMRGRTIGTSVSVPMGLLGAVEEICKPKGKPISNWIVEAMEQRLARDTAGQTEVQS